MRWEEEREGLKLSVLRGPKRALRPFTGGGLSPALNKLWSSSFMVGTWADLDPTSLPGVTPSIQPVLWVADDIFVEMWESYGSAEEMGCVLHAQWTSWFLGTFSKDLFKFFQLYFWTFWWIEEFYGYVFSTTRTSANTFFFCSEKNKLNQKYQFHSNLDSETELIGASP